MKPNISKNGRTKKRELWETRLDLFIFRKAKKIAVTSCKLQNFLFSLVHSVYYSNKFPIQQFEELKIEFYLDDNLRCSWCDSQAREKKLNVMQAAYRHTSSSLTERKIFFQQKLIPLYIDYLKMCIEHTAHE